MKFSDYEARGKGKQKSGNGRISDENKKLLFSVLKDYEGKSRAELVKGITEQAEKLRAEGKLSDAELDSFSLTLAPFLDGRGREELAEIVARIKKL